MIYRWYAAYPGFSPTASPHPERNRYRCLGANKGFDLKWASHFGLDDLSATITRKELNVRSAAGNFSSRAKSPSGASLPECRRSLCRLAQFAHAEQFPRFREKRAVSMLVYYRTSYKEVPSPRDAIARRKACHAALRPRHSRAVRWSSARPVANLDEGSVVQGVRSKVRGHRDRNYAGRD